MSKKRKTVGQHAVEAKKTLDKPVSAIDQRQEMMKEWDQYLGDGVRQGIKAWDTDFYINVITKKERLLDNVLRNYFLPRQTCPTPDYDQTVYRYHRESDELEYLWVVPDKETCLIFLENHKDIVPEERHLLDHIIDFASGELYKKCRKLNNEADDAPIAVLSVN